MSKAPLLVTGASGHLGRQVLSLLLARNAGPIIATTRQPASLADFAARGVDVRRADFDDPASLAVAFAGAKRALLISTDAVDRPGARLAQHRAAIAAFVTAGVEHVVYTSLPNPVGSATTIAADHAGTEAALAATKLDYTILRNNLYADLLLFSLPNAVATGSLIDARGNGAIAWVTRDDCAAAAAGALLEGAGRTTTDVTGPAAITSAELAAITSRVSGRAVAHVAVPAADLIAGMVAHGMPQPIAELYASFDVSTAKGEYAAVSDTVARFAGRPATTVEAFLRDHAAALLPKG